MLLGASRELPSKSEEDALAHETWVQSVQKVGLTNSNRPQQYFDKPDLKTPHDGDANNERLSANDEHANLVSLVQTYLTTMNSLGVETFLFDESLLAWYRSRKVAPGNNRIKVMITEPSMYRLAAYHNMTVHTFRIPALDTVKNYVLKIKPLYASRQIGQVDTVDAHWIDMQTEQSIDVETFRPALSVEGSSPESALDQYKYEEVYPLKDDVFEGVPVKVPQGYRRLLIKGYGSEALYEAAV